MSGIKTVDKKMDSAADEKVIIDINEPELNENTAQSTIDLQTEDETGGGLEIRQEPAKHDIDGETTDNEELEFADTEEVDELEIKTEDIQEKAILNTEEVEPAILREPVLKADDTLVNATVVEPVVVESAFVEPVIAEPTVVEPVVVEPVVVEPTVPEPVVVEPTGVKVEGEKVSVKKEETPVQEDTLPVKTIINELNPVEESVYTNKQAKTRRPRRSRALTMKEAYTPSKPTVQKSARRTQRGGNQASSTNNLNRKSRFRKRTENLISLK